MIRKFDETKGLNITKIESQSRFAYAVTDFEDFYDVLNRNDKHGYRGAVIKFYDTDTGKVYTPFEKERNVTYGKPLYFNGYYFFLKGDFNKNTIILYKYYPGSDTQVVQSFAIDKTELYNLSLMGEGVSVVSQKDFFNCYYPYRISFPLQPNETAVIIRENRVYLEAWFEDGWDSENDRASEDYKFYNKIIIKDFDGNTVSEETGSLYITDDGTVWIS